MRATFIIAWIVVFIALSMGLPLSGILIVILAAIVASLFRNAATLVRAA